jgi:hypothetical protein
MEDMACFARQLLVVSFQAMLSIRCPLQTLQDASVLPYHPPWGGDFL